MTDFNGFNEEEFKKWEREEHTLQEWIEYAEYHDECDGDFSQYEIKLKKV